MSTAPSAISGTGSGADPIGSDIDLSEVESPSTEGQVTDEPAIDTPTQDTEGQPPVGGTVDTPKEDGRRLPQSIRALKEANPEAYKAAKGAFFENLAFRQEFPNVQAAREASGLLKSVGGAEGIKTLREDAGVFKEAATQFLKGDPAFVKDLWEEDPIAAALHVAPMLETMKQRDFEGYKSTVTRLWNEEFQAVGLGPALKNLMTAAQKGDKDAMLGIAQSINGWYESIAQLASRAEDPRVKSLLAERAKQHETREQTEQQEFLKTYRTDTINQVAEEAFKVFDSFFKGRNIDKEDRLDLIREACSVANRAVEADKAFMEERDKHLANRDSHAAQQLTKARFARELPDAVKRIARRYGMVSGSAAPAKQTPTGQKPGQAQAAAPGWTPVNARPQAEEIDRGRTSNEMIISGRAILKDGKKVDWSRLKQA